MKASFLDDAVEDALISLKEQDILLPKHVYVWYTDEEWSNVEKFYRLRVRKDGKIGILPDRYLFIHLNFMGIDVTLAPEPKHTETIH